MAALSPDAHPSPAKWKCQEPCQGPPSLSRGMRGCRASEEVGVVGLAEWTVGVVVGGGGGQPAQDTGGPLGLSPLGGELCLQNLASLGKQTPGLRRVPQASPEPHFPAEREESVWCSEERAGWRGRVSLWHFRAAPLWNRPSLLWLVSSTAAMRAKEEEAVRWASASGAEQASMSRSPCGRQLDPASPWPKTTGRDEECRGVYAGRSPWGWTFKKQTKPLTGLEDVSCPHPR